MSCPGLTVVYDKVYDIAREHASVIPTENANTYTGSAVSSPHRVDQTGFPFFYFSDSIWMTGSIVPSDMSQAFFPKLIRVRSSEEWSKGIFISH